jgi:hypothetical protein
MTMIFCFRLSEWLDVGVDPVLRHFHHVEVSCVAIVSEEHVTSIFRVNREGVEIM